MAGTHADQHSGSATPFDPEDLDWVPQPRPRPKRRGRRVAWAAVVVVVVLAAGAGFWVQRSYRHPQASPPPGIAAGLRWSRVAGTMPVLPTAVVAGGPGFIAGSAASGAPLWTSPDGANWSQVPVTDRRLGLFHPQVIASFGGRIYAAGRQDEGSGSDPQARFGVWSSTDGQIWSPAETPATTLQPPANLTSPQSGLVVSGLARDPTGLVAVGYLADVNRSLPLAWYSPDGRTWHAAELPPDDPKQKPNAGRRLNGVIAIPGGFLAVEGAMTSSDEVHTGAEFIASVQRGPAGMIFSSDGQRWRAARSPSAPFPGGGSRMMIPGLLKLDAGRVLAVGVDPEAREVVDRSQAEARRVVVDRARPILWRLRAGKGWYQLSQPLPQSTAEFGSAQPAQASVRALADIHGTLVAVGDVTHGDAGDPSDAAVWTSTDGGLTWSDAVSGARFTGIGSGSLTALSVSGNGSTVVAIGRNSAGTAELWRAVPTGGS